MNKEKQTEFIEKWKTFYKANSNNPLLEEVEFRGMAIGFFGALGVTIKEANALYDQCIVLGCF